MYNFKSLIISVLFLLLTQNIQAQSYADKIESHRENYKANFLKESRSPLQEEDFQHLHFYPADENFQVLAQVKVLKKQKIFTMPTFDGTGKEFKRHFALSFTLQGKKFSLIAYKNMALAINPAYQDYLFVPFTDISNGTETYAGGRYLDLKISDIDNKTIWIDFNKAYNPYCAYSDGYRCPVPPEENNLMIKISAGEKNYTGTKKKSKN